MFEKPLPRPFRVHYLSHFVISGTYQTQSYYLAESTLQASHKIVSKCDYQFYDWLLAKGFFALVTPTFNHILLRSLEERVIINLKY